MKRAAGRPLQGREKPPGLLPAAVEVMPSSLVAAKAGREDLPGAHL